MESITYLFSSLPHSRESALRMTASVEENPNLAAGLLLGQVFMGLATYILVFWLQRSKLEGLRLTIRCQTQGLNNIQKIQGNLLSLLFVDFVTAIITITVAIGIFTSTCNSESFCTYAVMAWYLSRFFGMVVHLLNVMVCLCFLCHPERGAKQWHVYIPLIVSLFGVVPIFLFVGMGVLWLLQVKIIVYALVIAVKCVVSTASPSYAIWKKLIVLVAMLTFLIVFTPTFLLECLMITKPVQQHYLNALFYTNFQLLLDGLLCYCFLKLPSEDQQQQEHQQQHMTFENNNYNMSSNVNVPKLNMSHIASQQLPAVGGGSSSA